MASCAFSGNIACFGVSLFNMTTAQNIGFNLERFLSDSIQFQLFTFVRAGIGDSGLQQVIKEVTDLQTYNTLYKDSPTAANASTGLLGMAATLNGKLYQPPASGIEYIAQSFDGFLGKPAYAQGVGFSGLQALIPIWKIFRNIVYILASVVFIAIGIMIMLRMKISPQAVVTLQSALPQIIITLILVTFSYAIAGLLIDLGNLIQTIVLLLLYNGSPNSNLINPLAGTITWLGNTKFSDLANTNLYQILQLATNSLPTLVITILLTLLFGSIGALIGAVAGGGVVGTIVIGIIGLLIGILLVTIILLYWIVKLFFGLLKCYIKIIFKIILAPIEIGMGAFPSSKMGFNSWITDLIANIAVFPGVFLFMVLLNLIISEINKVGSVGLWMPQLLSNSLIADVTKGLAGGPASLATFALGIAGLGIMSQLPELIPQAVFMLKPSPFETAIGRSYTAPRAVQNFVGEVRGNAAQGVYENWRDHGILGGRVPNTAEQAFGRVIGGIFGGRSIKP